MEAEEAVVAILNGLNAVLLPDLPDPEVVSEPATEAPLLHFPPADAAELGARRALDFEPDLGGGAPPIDMLVPPRLAKGSYSLAWW